MMSASERPIAGLSWQTPVAIIAAVALLIARKPWAFTTPQLWAEDGSVFLTQNDQLGAHAIFTPYQGYLHFLPRLIAWTASHIADVDAWPLLYNGGTLLVTIVMLARFASPRIDLPGKPWLALAFPLAAHTGEVLFNITNLHWLTAFFLVQQALIARPTTAGQRVTDLAITISAGLTGPFSVLLWPLFAWRWARDHHHDNLMLLLVVTACAAVQAALIVANPVAGDAPTPLRPLMLAAVLGSRLIVWPLLGPRIAEALPLWGLALIGTAILGLIVGWALRADPRREMRAKIIFILIVLAASGAWRCRPDTWETANLANGDRYFFIPRVLMVWLIICEFDAAVKTVAWLARACCFTGAVLTFSHLRITAPPDYHWAEHCDPIRRGVPASIPTLPEGWTLEYPGRPPAR